MAYVLTLIWRKNEINQSSRSGENDENVRARLLVLPEFACSNATMGYACFFVCIMYDTWVRYESDMSDCYSRRYTMEIRNIYIRFLFDISYSHTKAFWEHNNLSLFSLLIDFHNA